MRLWLFGQIAVHGFRSTVWRAPMSGKLGTGQLGLVLNF